METLIPRGIRNNNPLNIRISPDAWQGRVPADQQTDKAFFQFTEFRYGFRAAMKLLRNYVDMHNLRSIEQIISRWAPPSENATDVYIRSVCRMMDEDKFFQPCSTMDFFKLAASMAVVESTRRVWMDAERRNQAFQAAVDLGVELSLSTDGFDADSMFAFLDRLSSPNAFGDKHVNDRSEHRGDKKGGRL